MHHIDKFDAFMGPNKITGKRFLVIKRYRPYGIACEKCDARLIAPIWSEYVSESQVRHSWSCESCGHQFVTSDYLRLDRPDVPRTNVQSPSLPQ
jgi:DNA-directed RNA polymerase subunit RPC12/RpoP